jgi:8-oxo-dGTP pyrophosphatase MutT (NUDIX family)
VLLFPRGSEAHVLLTVRKSDLTRHAGQVSLPGGIPHAGESLEEAALRETEEEVGVPVDSVRVLGALTPLHIPVSGFDLHSFAGVLASAGSFTPHALEVERILEAPLGELVSGEAIGVETRMIADREVRVPFYRIEGEKVWGATAMVLSEVLVLLGSTSRPRA